MINKLSRWHIFRVDGLATFLKTTQFLSELNGTHTHIYTAFHTSPTGALHLKIFGKNTGEGVLAAVE